MHGEKAQTEATQAWANVDELQAQKDLACARQEMIAVGVEADGVKVAMIKRTALRQ